MTLKPIVLIMFMSVAYLTGYVTLRTCRVMEPTSSAMAPTTQQDDSRASMVNLLQANVPF